MKDYGLKTFRFIESLNARKTAWQIVGTDSRRRAEGNLLLMLLRLTDVELSSDQMMGDDGTHPCSDS